MLESWFNPGPADAPVVERSPETQLQVDAQTATLALYHYDSCMYCGRVRKAIANLRLKIETRDVLRDMNFRRELAAGGGRTTVPCLRMDEHGQVCWMYESTAIIEYLIGRFGAAQRADGV